MGMDFRRGCRGYTEFPTGDAVFSLQFLDVPQVVTIAKKLEQQNYYDGDSSNIQRDLGILDDCDKHARQTNDFYEGGSRMEYYMKDWMDKTKDYKSLKSKITAAKIGQQIQKYNDYLEKAMANAYREKANKLAQEWNYERHPKKSRAANEIEHSRTVNGYTYYWYTTSYTTYTSGRATGNGWEELNPPSGYWWDADLEYDEIRTDSGVWNKISEVESKNVVRELRKRGKWPIQQLIIRPSTSYYR